MVILSHVSALPLLLLLSAAVTSGCTIGGETGNPYWVTGHQNSLSLRNMDTTGSDEVQQGRPIEEFYPEAVTERKKSSKMIRLGMGRDEALALGCGMGDRFDSSAALAYNFDDQQSRISLHMSLDGPSLSNPANLEMNSVLVRFTYKFQKPSKMEDARCLYPSHVQGLIGSTYNEFFVRTNYTILDELKDRGLDLK